MNIDVLREDEISVQEGDTPASFCHRLQERLSEERKKNAELNGDLNSLSDALDKLEAELAEARKAYYEHCQRCGDHHSPSTYCPIDAVTKEVK